MSNMQNYDQLIHEIIGKLKNISNSEQGTFSSFLSIGDDTYFLIDSIQFNNSSFNDIEQNWSSSKKMFNDEINKITTDDNTKKGKIIFLIVLSAQTMFALYNVYSESDISQIVPFKVVIKSNIL
ncbi:MAG: hypothetical protein GY754_46655 [bacterium]|nr:hypothetical protein [bacterium]